MNCEFVLPEFDPQLHPIGYALARAMPDESTVDAVVERRRAKRPLRVGVQHGGLMPASTLPDRIRPRVSMVEFAANGVDQRVDDLPHRTYHICPIARGAFFDLTPHLGAVGQSSNRS